MVLATLALHRSRHAEECPGRAAVVIRASYGRGLLVGEPEGSDIAAGDSSQTSRGYFDLRMRVD